MIVNCYHKYHNSIRTKSYSDIELMLATIMSLLLEQSNEIERLSSIKNQQFIISNSNPLTERIGASDCLNNYKGDFSLYTKAAHSFNKICFQIFTSRLWLSKEFYEYSMLNKEM